MIETHFDVPFVARMALREKQIQQNYRPIISVHKWFARRPGTLFRGLILSEFIEKPVAEIFCRTNQLPNLEIADPFMGGGTPLIEANRLGCNITGYDINPMSYWIVRQEIEHINLKVYHEETARLISAIERECGCLYKTNCVLCGEQAWAKYFLWIKQHTCPGCQRSFDLAPGYLLAKDIRHPANVIVCRQCGSINEAIDLGDLGYCLNCSQKLGLDGNVSRNIATCTHCGRKSKYPNGKSPPAHRMFAIEYYCRLCRSKHQGRFFKKPDDNDIQNFADAIARLERTRCRFVPDESIPDGDETKRLFRWGYRRFREMFNARQLLGLEISCRYISKVQDKIVRNALATNLSDLLRYQNMLCRYDTMALKSLDVFSIHGFPVSLVECESNLLGIKSKKGGNVGSGGWLNITDKYTKGKEYCDQPYEINTRSQKKQIIYTNGEWIGESKNGGAKRKVLINCGDSSQIQWKPNSLDAVFTDPPYFGNIQYAELMDFCYVWLRRLIGTDNKVFQDHSTCNESELTGNVTGQRGIEHFTDGLSKIFRSMATALKQNAPLAFTYHHNTISAYFAIGVALLDSRLACTATLPCPAEMGGSIHIYGTGSSIIDTVFICRKGAKSHAFPTDPISTLTEETVRDIQALSQAGYRATVGDINCIVNGHITRLAVNKLNKKWNICTPIKDRLEIFKTAILGLPSIDKVMYSVDETLAARNQKAMTLFEL